jgi:hypothetical protein
VPSKDLTWNLFGKDVTASKAFKDVADEVRHSTGRMSDDVDKWDERNKKAAGKGSGMGLLLTSIVALGPAAVPLAGVAAGLGAGFVAAAGVAVVGIMGIKDEMKRGTQIGLQYKAGIATLNTEFVKMKQIAAAGLLGGFQASIKALQPMFPALNRDVALFSSQLGQVAGHVAPALVSLFHGLNPLFTTFGQLLVTGSAGLQHWAGSSDAVGKFVGYVQTELPNVLHTLGELITTVSHLGMAFAPLGSASLTTLRLLATAINAIPINVLQTMVPVVTASVLAFKGFQTLQGLSSTFAGFSAKLAGMGGAASGAAGLVGGASKAIGAMGIAGLVAGPAIGLLVSWLGKQKQAQAEAKAEVNDYTQALLASNLAIDAGVRSTAAKKLADTKAFEAASTLGIAQGALVDAITGTGTASADLAAKLGPLVAQYNVLHASAGKQSSVTGTVTQAQRDAAGAANDLNNILSKQSVEFKHGVENATNQKAAIDEVSKAQGMSATTAAANARAMGMTTAEYLIGHEAALKNAASVDKQAQAMRFANDAAGLLKQSLDTLNGVTLDVAAAQTAASSAWLSMTKTIHDNGNTTKLNTDAGVANRQAIEQGVRANQAYAEAEAKKTKSGKAANKMLTDQRTAFIGAIEKTYGANSAIAVYVRSIYGIPAKKTTAIDAETAAANKKIADTKAMLLGIANKKVRIDGELHGLDKINADLDWAARDRLAVINVQQNTGERHGAGAVHPAGGGYISGAGSGTSDSIPAMVSNGEYVVKASVVRQNRRLLDHLNSGGSVSGGGMDERSLARAFKSALEGASLRIYGDDGSSRRADLLTRAG